MKQKMSLFTHWHLHVIVVAHAWSTFHLALACSRATHLGSSLTIRHTTTSSELRLTGPAHLRGRIAFWHSTASSELRLAGSHSWTTSLRRLFLSEFTSHINCSLSSKVLRHVARDSSFKSCRRLAL
jgi:hypothetical protein